jgi:prepilin peptidase CpaA
MIHFLSVTIFPVLMIIAGAGDALSLRIPNWLTGLIAVLFVPMAFATGMPLDQFGLHLVTGFALFFVGFALFAVGLFGGGDAKLIAAAGLWFGWPDILPFLVLTALAGGLLALVIGVWSMLSMSAEIHFESWAKRIIGLKPNVPYGYALAVGAILAFPQSWWMPGALA